MIYTRFGGHVTIKANCGLHLPLESKYEARLIKIDIVYPDTGKKVTDRYYFAEFLRADKGYAEINEALRELEIIELTGDELDNAIEQAS